MVWNETEGYWSELVGEMERLVKEAKQHRVISFCLAIDTSI